MIDYYYSDIPRFDIEIEEVYGFSNTLHRNHIKVDSNNNLIYPIGSNICISKITNLSNNNNPYSEPTFRLFQGHKAPV